MFEVCAVVVAVVDVDEGLIPALPFTVGILGTGGVC